MVYDNIAGKIVSNIADSAVLLIIQQYFWQYC